MISRSLILKFGIFCWLILLAEFSVQAQWTSQSVTLKPGWNAVYLHVDLSHETLDRLVGSAALETTPIEEIWMWFPAVGLSDLLQSPQDPLITTSQWRSWKRSTPGASALQRLPGNSACLVFSSSAMDYVWTFKGKPQLPNHQWTSSGLNFLGIPTSKTNPPNFESYLSQSPLLYQNVEIFEYTGGQLGAGNPSRVIALRTTPVQRGKAFWMRAGLLYNRYYGPFEIRNASTKGIDFGSALSTVRFRLRNFTASPLTITAEHLLSESAPADQTPIAGPPPLLIRGDINPSDLTFGYSPFLAGDSHSWTLPPVGQPGAEIEVVIGLVRSSLAGDPAAHLASIIRFTDSLGFLEVDMGVTATAGSRAGLWVGEAAISQVQSSIKSYQRDATGAPITSTQDTNFGSYIVTSVNENLGAVPRVFPLRLIVHNDGTTASLLQRVFYGFDSASNLINATQEDFLDPNRIGTARRVTAAHLPFTPENTFWNFSNPMVPGSFMTATVTVAHDEHASNPFLHTYHPDHDNLDARFSDTPLPTGFESYRVLREITLSLNPPSDNFTSIVGSGQIIEGVYHEILTFEGKQAPQGPESRSFISQGKFILRRLNDIPVLTAP